jgi:hypothetical protein
MEAFTMLNKLTITTALTSLVIATAAAQSPASDNAQSNTPATTQSTPATPKSDDKLASKGSAQVITSQQPDELLASRFKGTNVVGADDKSIGSVSDVLFLKDGKVKAYVISVGGFLGIGSKDVALAPQSFQLVAGDKSKGESDKLKIAMSADDLKQAANFEAYNPSRMSTNTSGSGVGSSRPITSSQR